MTDLHVRAGSATTALYALEITPATAGWGHASLRVLELAAGATHRLDTGEEEMVVLPLAGSCEVACDGELFTLAGRRDVFSRVTDTAYLPREAVSGDLDRRGRPVRPRSRCAVPGRAPGR